MTNPEAPVCPSCARYFQVSPVNYILAFGIRWRYYDPAFLDQTKRRKDRVGRGLDTRGALRVYVDSEELADIVSRAHADVVLHRDS